MNQANRTSHRLQHQKENKLDLEKLQKQQRPTALTEPSESVVQRPAVFNERSASPWERTKNASAREQNQPQGGSTKERNWKMMQQKSSTLNNEHEDNQKDRESKENEEKSENRAKIRVPRRPMDKITVSSARDKYKAKSQEKSEAETEGHEVSGISTARTDK